MKDFHFLKGKIVSKKNNYDYITIETEAPIVAYCNNRIQICKDLGHWKYLTPDEQTRFRNSRNKDEITRFMITSRTRAAAAD